MSDNAQGAAAAALAEPAQPAATPATPAQPAGVQPRSDPGTPAAAWKAPDWAKDWSAEDLGYLEKKRLDDPRKLYDSYRNLERTLSDDRVALPKDWGNQEEVDKFYNRVGRPDSPDKYVAPKDADANMFKALAPELHGAGLTQAQVDKITQGYNKFAQAQIAEQANAWIADQNDAQARLEKEWGAKTPQEVEHNRRAMRALGISVDEATAYMRGGAEKFLRLLNTAGHMIAEDNSGDIQSDATLGFGLTPNRAAADLAELRSNKDFMQRVYSGDQVAKNKYNRLVATAAEGGQVRRTVRSGFKNVG